MSCSIIHCRSFYGRYQRDRTSTGYVTPQTDHTSLVVLMINSFCDCITSLGCSAIPSTFEQLFWVKEHWRTIIHLPPCAVLKARASSPQMPWLVWFARSPVTRPEVWQEHWKNTDSLNSCWFLCCRRCIHPILQICGWSPSCRISNPGFPLRNILSSLESPSHLPGRQPSPSRIDNRSPQPSLNLRGDHTLTRFTKATTFSNSCWAWQALSHPLQLKPFQSSKIFRDHEKWSNSMKPCVCVWHFLLQLWTEQLQGALGRSMRFQHGLRQGRKNVKLKRLLVSFYFFRSPPFSWTHTLWKHVKNSDGNTKNKWFVLWYCTAIDEACLTSWPKTIIFAPLCSLHLNFPTYDSPWFTNLKEWATATGHLLVSGKPNACWPIASDSAWRQWEILKSGCMITMVPTRLIKIYTQ